MKILMGLHDYPSAHTGGILPAFNVLKYLSEKNEITLLCFVQERGESKPLPHLDQYYEAIETVKIRIPRATLCKILLATRNTLSPRNLLAKNRCFFNICYSPEMRRKLDDILNRENFDLVYADYGTAYLFQHIHLPKIVHTLDCWTEAYHQQYRNARRLMTKLPLWLHYLQARVYEFNIYKYFDACIVVSQPEKDAISSFLPGIDIRVIPNGVDSGYFRPGDKKEEVASIVFVGEMSSIPNIDAVLHFHQHIYGYVKRNVPGVKFYIVGQNPTREVQQLATDETVTVTGFVEDVRPYLATSSVVVIPMISGRGIKNKVLEAMSMGKAVITTSIGAQGIDVTPGKNIIVADEPIAFAQQLVELINNKRLRQRIANNARKFVETQYSWEKVANALNKLFEEKVRGKSTELIPTL